MRRRAIHVLLDRATSLRRLAPRAQLACTRPEAGRRTVSLACRVDFLLEEPRRALLVQVGDSTTLKAQRAVKPVRSVSFPIQVRKRRAGFALQAASTPRWNN
jgi:hypothetical protein